MWKKPVPMRACTHFDVKKRETHARATVDVDDGVYVEPSRLTLGKWLDTWLEEYAKPSIKLSTYLTYEQRIRVNLKPAIGEVKLTALTAPMIQKLYNQMNISGLAPKSVKNIHGVLHKALGQAVKLGFLKVNPSDVCKLPRMTKKAIKHFDRPQISAFLKAIKGHRYETLYIVTLFCGMRQSEVLGLKWDCINFSDGSIRIVRQLQKEKVKGGVCYLSSVKNDKERRIPPAPYVMKLLQTHREEQEKQRLFVGSAWLGDDYVFTNELGEHLLHSSVYKEFKKVAVSVGAPECRFHDLRHSYAVAALESGDNIKSVQENLGHHSVAFTLDTYGHVTDLMMRESANKMETYIHNVNG